MVDSPARKDDKLFSAARPSQWSYDLSKPQNILIPVQSGSQSTQSLTPGGSAPSGSQTLSALEAGDKKRAPSFMRPISHAITRLPGAIGGAVGGLLGAASALYPKSDDSEGPSGGDRRSLGSDSAPLAFDVPQSKADKLVRLMQEPMADLDQIKKAAWGGVPSKHRAQCWNLLTGYVPCQLERRAAVLQRKRDEYRGYLEQLKRAEAEERPSEYELGLKHQIQIDVPRTNPDAPFLQITEIQQCLERILLVWSIRHPASGYVQGLNDLVTPFLATFLSEHLDLSTMELTPVDSLPSDTLSNAEADSFWCFSKLLDSIQDHYTFAQPGIQRMVFRLKEIIHRLDLPLYDHFQKEGLEVMQFAFRWMNCLLVRELPLRLILRMWDTYLAEGTDTFAFLHVYVCAAFLLTWSPKLRSLDFTDMVLFLQNLPTDGWDYNDVQVLLSQAFMWKELFANSPSHLTV